MTEASPYVADDQRRRDGADVFHFAAFGDADAEVDSALCSELGGGLAGFWVG